MLESALRSDFLDSLMTTLHLLLLLYGGLSRLRSSFCLGLLLSRSFVGQGAHNELLFRSLLFVQI